MFICVYDSREILTMEVFLFLFFRFTFTLKIIFLADDVQNYSPNASPCVQTTTTTEKRTLSSKSLLINETEIIKPRSKINNGQKENGVVRETVRDNVLWRDEQIQKKKKKPILERYKRLAAIPQKKSSHYGCDHISRVK